MASDVEEGKGPGLSPADAGKQAGGKRRSTTFPSRALNVLTAACTLLCMVAFGLAIALGPHARDLQGFCQQALRVYGIALGLFILLVRPEPSARKGQLQAASQGPLSTSRHCQGWLPLFPHALTVGCLQTETEWERFLSAARVLDRCGLHQYMHARQPPTVQCLTGHALPVGPAAGTSPVQFGPHNLPGGALLLTAHVPPAAGHSGARCTASRRC